MKNKKALLMSIICIILIVILVIVGVYKLNTKNLKGELKEYRDYEMGDEFCLDTECFYVVFDDPETNEVTALAKYNLLVGNKVRMNGYNSEILDTYNENTPGYNLQNSEALGAVYVNGVIETNSIAIGTLAFADYSSDHYPYWADDNGHLKSEYGSSYPADVFNGNSNLWQYIDYYNTYLISRGFTSVHTTIPSYSLMNTRCQASDCSWARSTSFWLREAESSTTIYEQTSQPALGNSFYSTEFYYGVRPLIIIDKSEIPGSLVSVPDSACNSIEAKDHYERNDILSICNNNIDKREDFYVISDDGENIVALAKYNLAVGKITKIYTDDGELRMGNTLDVSTSKPYYNLQDSRYKGGLFTESWYGTIAFSDDKYWSGSADVYDYPAKVYNGNSNLKQYVDVYENYLNDIVGEGAISASIPDLELVTGLGCTLDGDEGTCANAEPWVHSTAYWLQDAQNSKNIYVIVGGIYDEHGGILSYVDYDNDTYIGLRPVITINRAKIATTTEETTEDDNNAGEKPDDNTSNTIDNNNDNDDENTKPSSDVAEEVSEPIKDVDTTISTSNNDKVDDNTNLTQKNNSTTNDAAAANNLLKGANEIIRKNSTTTTKADSKNLSKAINVEDVSNNTSDFNLLCYTALMLFVVLLVLAIETIVNRNKKSK